MKIEDYGLIGDTHTAALVGRNGSIDWLCLPRFDSGACFAALLGTERNGFWEIAPDEPVRASHRRYIRDTMVLETDFETATGAVRITDCMPIRERHPHVVRIVSGRRGRVAMRMRLVIRFDYGAILPWVHRRDTALEAKAGPDAVILRTPVPTRGEDFTTVASFTVGPGEEIPFSLSWYPSHTHPPAAVDPAAAVKATIAWWRKWVEGGGYSGEWAEAVRGSAMVLKALTYAPTGGIIAAPTTSLPESLGGGRNWDYRFCWLRDAAFTLDALLAAGYKDEAGAWRDWLLRAIAGASEDVQTLYGPAGERRVPEFELPHLAGYEASRPVRIGNAASDQYQLDVYGEVVDALHRARAASSLRTENEKDAWSLQQKLLEFVESHWAEPDNGIWELRGERRHFTYSKAMAWAAVDRTVAGAERYGLPCELDRWRALRGKIHEEVCRRGFHSERQAFTQSFGSTVLDASVLRLPLVGFLPADDPRMLSTVRAIERELVIGRYVARYTRGTDNLEGTEGVFLPCTFWLADNYALAGRGADARALFERLLALRNDLGLLSEEYHPGLRRQLGNFPQAFTHVALINSAVILSRQSAAKPAA
ncbi:MAG: glycoside hydrolase family 15 protein [Opitutaceae bacterium]